MHTPLSEASVDKTIWLFFSGQSTRGVDTRTLLRFIKAPSCLGSQVNAVTLLVRSVSGPGMLAKYGMKWW